MAAVAPVVSASRMSSTVHYKDTEPRTVGGRRSCAKLIRFAPDELAAVLARARAAGRPVACYIRESSIGATPRVRRSELNDALVRELERTTTRLFKLAEQARLLSLADAAELEAAAEALLSIIRRVD